MSWSWRLLLFLWVLTNPKETAGAEYINVALGKPTDMINVYLGGYSKLAVDGNFASRFFEKSCTHTEEGYLAWWVVDLLLPFPITSISLTNRNAGPERLGNFRVMVTDTNPLPLPPTGSHLIGQLCMYLPGHVPLDGPHHYLCEQNITGRYVYLYKVGTGPLTLCEVEVFVSSIGIRLRPERFRLEHGRKSNLIPFYSETINQPSCSKCVVVCVSREEGVATIVQFDKSTKTCECIENTPLGTSGTNFTRTLDVDWILMDAIID